MATRKRGGARGTGRAKANGTSNGTSNRTRAGERAAAIAGRPARGAESHPTVRPRGTLLVIGGREDKVGDKLILRYFAEQVGSGKLVVATIASELSREQWKDYEQLFRGLGIRHVHHLRVETREEARSDARLRILDDATAVFFTGGDQLKLTSLLGDTPIYERIKTLYENGATIAGTSAGASVVCETMLVSGGGDESHRIGSNLAMAPGFGLISGVIIDQHFAERGRIGRLIGAVAQNPRMLGIGIDEDTAIVCEPRGCFRVLGAGAVYVVDGQDITYSNLTVEKQDATLSSFGLRLHVLSMGDRFELITRVPTNGSAEDVEDEVLGTKR